MGHLEIRENHRFSEVLIKVSCGCLVGDRIVSDACGSAFYLLSLNFGHASILRQQA